MSTKTKPIFIILGLCVLIIAIWLFANSEKQATPATNTVAPQVQAPQTITPVAVEPKPAAKPIVKAELPTYSITIKSGDSLAKIFKRLNIPYTQLLDLLKSKPIKAKLAKIRAGHQLKFYLDAKNNLQRIDYKVSATDTLQIKRENNQFVSETIKTPYEIQPVFAETTIQHSLAQAGNKAHLPYPVLQQMVQLLSWDLNPSKDIRQGDHFAMLYQERLINGKKVGTGDILALQYVNRGKPIEIVNFIAPDGTKGFYHLDGSNVQKQFLRTPVHYTHISSKFTRRRWHPVLHIYREHLGVDLAAPSGTPIVAASDGKIIYRGRYGGYGNCIILQHGLKYRTVYGHMSRFAKNQRVGTRVKRGELIGYVGMTGLATGPHLHYEFRVYNHPENPMTVKLPDGRAVAKKDFPEFNKQKNILLAQLNAKDTKQQLAKNNQTEYPT